VILKKLENSLSLDYPKDKLQVLVISDGSDDGTDEIVRTFENRGVILCRQEPRGGKSHGLTRFVPEARGDLLVFSDANSMYHTKALRHLVGHFSDPSVGYVVGYQHYAAAQTSAVSRSEGLYWRYEKFLKQCESKLSSVVGGDGAIYAMRASLFAPLLDDDISDFLLPLQIVARGYRGVFEPAAVCEETTAASFHGEFRRKVRIVTRSLLAVFRVPQVLNPFRVGWFTYQLFLHKLVRWFVPFLLLGILLTSLYLAWLPDAPAIYRAALAAQLGVYGLACLRAVPFVGELKPVYLAYYFCLVNLAALVGVLKCLAGYRVATWNPERTSTSDEVAVTAEQ
jgi:cellulose synthase/poly-beta-1,6-N-acetylglucosamine synthase-like glycosyltransferase